MDENTTEGSTGERDVADETRYFTLALTEAGWGVWDRTRSSEEPVVMFPPDDHGFDLAWDYFAKADRAARIRLGPWLGRLWWVALIAGCLWVALNATVQLRFFLGGDSIFSSEGVNHVFYWAQGLGGIAYSVFFVSVGAYVLLWLRGQPRP